VLGSATHAGRHRRDHTFAIEVDSEGGISMAATDSAHRTARFVVVATVLGWNTLAMAVSWVGGAVAISSETGSENWAGFGILVVVLVLTLAIAISTLVGIVAAAVRIRTRHRLPLTGLPRAAVLAGSRDAAWGLGAILPVVAWVAWVLA
jgi:hypothetical protein